MHRSLLAALFLAATAQAQVVAGQIGFYADDGNGRTAGTICSGFTCTTANMVTKPNTKITFTVRAPKNAPCMVIAGAAPLQTCVSFPFFVNQLAVPTTLLLPGIVNQQDSVKCTGYRFGFSVTVPGNVKKGERLVLQALAETLDANSRTRGAFSTPINVIVL